MPDYQRAFSWELKQIDLFLNDLIQNKNRPNDYYFGHFIVEDRGNAWDIVDGQQRITTFILFLVVCRYLDRTETNKSAYSLIDHFTTVTYDQDAFKAIQANIGTLLERFPEMNERQLPTDSELVAALSFSGNFTRSLRRMMLALIRIGGILKSESQSSMDKYIKVVLNAHCSLHCTIEKTVAVSIFEMHNTRGVPLTTLEVLKAILMKFVFTHGGDKQTEYVNYIQGEFGAIYKMEERISESSFRNEMTMDQLLRLHLRTIDDGSKQASRQFHQPSTNATSEMMIDYVRSKLEFSDEERKSNKSPDEGVTYAKNLAKELRKSILILSEELPEWDKNESLVGDVMILDRELSGAFFLLVSRIFASSKEGTDGRVSNEILILWERLLFTRDFHEKYYRKSYRDNFEAIFETLYSENNDPVAILNKYVNDGFRFETRDLQKVVRDYLTENKPKVLNNAFNWWRHKMIYALYKYEKHQGVDLRKVMQGAVSVEHILAQNWQWEWLEDYPKNNTSASEYKAQKSNEIGAYINGIGNLLLISQSENSRLGNKKPNEKQYSLKGGSYTEHSDNSHKWASSDNWRRIIEERGKRIYDFILEHLVPVD